MPGAEQRGLGLSHEEEEEVVLRQPRITLAHRKLPRGYGLYLLVTSIQPYSCPANVYE